MSESAIPVNVSTRDCFHSSQDTTVIATTENPISSAVFQCDGESAKRLKAAPVFSVCVRRKNPGMIWMCRYIAMRVATRRLVQRSRVTTSRARRKWVARTRNIDIQLFSFVILRGVLCREGPVYLAGSDDAAGRLRRSLAPLRMTRRFQMTRWFQSWYSNSRSTALQRSQIVGYVLSSPTCVE